MSVLDRSMPEALDVICLILDNMNTNEDGQRVALHDIRDIAARAVGEDSNTQTTTYRYDDHDCAWRCSACGAYWHFIHGDPSENRMHYCPECGRYIERVEGYDDDDSDDA